jgi:tRNA (cmo5U34)-methyltransferase
MSETIPTDHFDDKFANLYSFPKDMWNASQYDSLRRMLIPSFDMLYQVAADYLAFKSRPDPDLLDIGAGTGLLTEKILSSLPKAKATLVDGSHEMLAQAKARLAHYKKCEFVVGDFSTSLPGGQFDAVVSALAIHHLRNERKRALFRRIFDILRPGGVFLNVEQVAGPSNSLEAFYDLVHEQHVLSEKTPAAEWGKARERMKYDIPASIDLQLGWLRSIGFDEVDCLAKNCRFATYAAVRL